MKRASGAGACRRPRSRRSAGRATSSGTQRPVRAPSRARELAGRPRGRRAPSRPARCGRRSSTRPAFDSRRGRASDRAAPRALAVGRGDDPQLVAGRPAARSATSRASEQLAQPRARRGRAGGRGRSRSRARCRPRSATRAAATSAVADSYRRAFSIATAACDGEQRRRAPRSSLGEVAAAVLLGQVEVAVGDAAQQDRHAEERASSAGGWAGSRPSAGRRRGRAGAAARASRISAPRMPAPARAGRRSPRACRRSTPCGDEALELRAGRGRSRRAPRTARRSARRPARRGAAAGRRGRAPEARAMPASMQGAQPGLARRRGLHAVSVSCRAQAARRVRPAGSRLISVRKTRKPVPGAADGGRTARRVRVRRKEEP